MAGRFSVDAVFRAVDKMTAPIAKMSASVDGFIKSTEKGLGRVSKFNDTISSSLKRVGVAVVGAGAATAAIVRDVITTGAEFDKTLVAAAAKFDPEIKRGTKGFEELRIAAESFGETTEFNAQQGAEALKTLAGAGFEAAQATALLPVVGNLATASEVGLAEASDIATKALGAFGLKTTDTAQLTANLARVTDVMAFAANKTEASMGSLFETIKEGAPVATAGGQSLETFMALAAGLAAAGKEGTEAGTTLKRVFTSFASGREVKALAEIGVKTKDSSGKMRDALDILEDVEKKLKGKGSAERLGILEHIFGQIPLAGVSTLLERGIGSIRELRRAAEEDAPKSLGKLALAMRDTVAGDIDEFTSAIDGVKIALFSTNNGPLRDSIRKMTQFVRANKPAVIKAVGDAVKWVGDNLPTIVTWAKRIATFVAVFYAWSTAIKTVQLAIQTYEAAATLATAANWLFRKSAVGLDKSATIFATAAESAGAFGQKINGVKGLLGQAGLLGAALLVGTAIGTWLNDTFKLDEKLSDLIDKMRGINRPATVDHPGLKTGDGGVLADGSVINPDGTVTKSAKRLAREKHKALAEAAKGMGKGPIVETVGVLADDIKAPEYAHTSPLLPPQVVSPQERIAKTVEETTTTQRSELTIKDETGRAELKEKPGSAQRVPILLQRAGAF
jgi:TP901 family phage tail tape measure protein